jgi:hypothetical protein
MSKIGGIDHQSFLTQASSIATANAMNANPAVNP